MAIKNLPTKLTLATFAMFGFGFALIPLYDVFCDIAGINGKGFKQATHTQIINQQNTTENPVSNNVRFIKVQFIASPQSGFSGDFYPKSASIPAGLGNSVSTAYFARNATQDKINLQAIPSIAPAEASSYVTKMECFCFTQQSLQPGQTREMGLTFKVSKELPPHISTITFSYALYPLTSIADDAQLNSAPDTAPRGQSNEPNT